jgi:mannose-1-phosphate guanylyltransferase
MIQRMYLVILADGRTRQRPPTGGELPVAFEEATDGRTLLERTVARVAPLVDLFDVVVVTDRRHGQTVRSLVPDALVLAEPIHRNTAASITLATVAVDRPGDEPMLVVVADHDIEGDEAFRDAVSTMATSLATASDGAPLVAFGVTPTDADPGSSYIRPRFGDAFRAGDLRGFPVEGYEAHPNATRARELFDSGTTYWSAGVFLWRRDDIRAAIERYTPLLTLIEPAHRSELALAAAYDRMQPLSIDETVLAGAAGDGAVVTIPLDVGWRAIGD